MPPDLRKELLRQMRELRARLDPKVVERVNFAVLGKVPFDRDNARDAVNRFLETRDDDGAFRGKLEDALKKEGVDVDMALTPPAKPGPFKPRRWGRLV